MILKTLSLNLLAQYLNRVDKSGFELTELRFKEGLMNHSFSDLESFKKYVKKYNLTIPNNESPFTPDPKLKFKGDLSKGYVQSVMFPSSDYDSSQPFYNLDSMINIIQISFKNGDGIYRIGKTIQKAGNYTIEEDKSNEKDLKILAFVTEIWRNIYFKILSDLDDISVTNLYNLLINFDEHALSLMSIYFNIFRAKEFGLIYKGAIDKPYIKRERVLDMDALKNSIVPETPEYNPEWLDNMVIDGGTGDDLLDFGTGEDEDVVLFGLNIS